MSELVTIAQFDTGPEAHLARTLLESHSISAFVIGDHSMSTNPLFTFHPGMSVQLQVRTEDLERALEVLGDSGKLDESVAASKLSCPQCRSQDISKLGLSRRSMIAWGYIFVPIAILLGFLRHRHRCKNCGHIWSD